MNDLNEALDLMNKENYTLVLYGFGEVITSRKKGVVPLIELLETKMDYTGYTALDKVVGKAAAFLYLLLGIKKIYAVTISTSALKLLRDRGVYVEYRDLTERIINRTNTGFCPVESAVLDINDENIAFDKIILTLNSLGV